VQKVSRRVALVKNTDNFSSYMGNGIVQKESPFQGHDIVFRRSGIVRETALLGPLNLGVGKRGVLFQEKVTNLSVEKKFFLSFKDCIRGFHNLLKENL
jgi:hypothetical protein